tara:strand:+ start:159 stop:1601 length:1443 start_codon:yes stop_codon:yes gene_type:complete
MKRAATPSFLVDNADQIKCLSLAAADTMFSAYMAVKTFEGWVGPWWFYFKDAVDSVAQLFSCIPPSEQDYEDAFGGDEIRCQCAEVAGELFLEYVDSLGVTQTVSQSSAADAKNIKTATVSGTDAVCTWDTVDGLDATSTYDIGTGTRPVWYIIPTLNTRCCTGTPVVPPVQDYPQPYELPGDGGATCPNEIYLLDSCVDRFGLVQNFYRVKEYKNDCTQKQQYYYWESVRGPFVYPITGVSFEGFSCDPIYAPPHPHAAEPGQFGVNQSNPGLSAVTYTLDVGCTYNPETEDFDKKFTYDVETTNGGILGLARRMDALAWMINNAALIPYTECSKCGPVLEGEWVTVRFESLENSPLGTRPLRKLFRYRSQSALDLGQKAAYWENFTWNAGAVCVQHKGAWWGTPQCWAANADEGKRVIRFAGLEAGIDPDVLGEWVISGSTDPRYGQPGSMRVAQVQGLEWVTSRQGPSGLPLLTVDP